MKGKSIVPMLIAKIGYIVVSGILCTLGVLFIVLPTGTAVHLATVCGVIMVAFGVIRIIGYCSGDLFRLAFQYDLEFGIFTIITGVAILTRSGEMNVSLPILLGVAVPADGLVKIRIALASKKFGIKKWYLILAFAVLSLCAGLLLLFRVSPGGVILPAILGTALICEGAMNLDVAVSTVKIVKNQLPDVPEEEWRGWGSRV